MFGYMTFESVITGLLVILVIQLFQIRTILITKLDWVNTHLIEVRDSSNEIFDKIENIDLD